MKRITQIIIKTRHLQSGLFIQILFDRHLRETESGTHAHTQHRSPTEVRFRVKDTHLTSSNPFLTNATRLHQNLMCLMDLSALNYHNLIYTDP